MSTINDRINNIITHFSSGNKRKFSLLIGVSATVIENVVGSRGGKPGFDVLEKILFSFENINGNWLITGKGEMLISDQKQERPVNDEPVKSDSGQIILLKEQIREKDNIIQELNRKIGQLEAQSDFLRDSVPPFGYSIASEPKLAHKKRK